MNQINIYIPKITFVTQIIRIITGLIFDWYLKTCKQQWKWILQADSQNHNKNKHFLSAF